MDNCAKCGAAGTALTRERLAEFQTVYLTLPVNLLNAVDRFTCNCGHSVESIPNHEGLIAAVAQCRIMNPAKLNGEEISLLRKVLGMKASAFAKTIDVDPSTLSRWENSAEPIGNDKERHLRVCVAAALKDKAPAIEVDFAGLVGMKISPVRPSPWPTLFLEPMRVKVGTKKETQYDKADAA